MKMEGVSTSVVVLAREHNPTILHPAFLTSQGLVPPDWELERKPVCTPAFSTVRYKNGITLSVENRRFQVAETNLTAGLAASQVARLASDYLAKLPHVSYTEVHVQLQAFVEQLEPGAFLIGRFLKAGKWNSPSSPLSGLGLRFEYSVSRAILELYCQAGGMERGEEEREGVVLNGLYISELPENDPLPQALSLLGMWEERCRDFIATANAVVGA
jgi:hypothetical protein